MPNTFTISVDAAALEASLLSLSQILKPFVKVASRISADELCLEAQTRLARQLSTKATGQTVDAITVKSDRTGWGWIVVAGNPTTPMLDRWLESGTVKMTARPFWKASIALEEAPHLSRIRGAVHAALGEVGL